MFKSFKKRLTIEKLLQGSLYALSGGLLASAIMIMIFQLLKYLDWYFYLIAIGGGLLVFGLILLVYYLINRVQIQLRYWETIIH